MLTKVYTSNNRKRNVDIVAYSKNMHQNMISFKQMADAYGHKTGRKGQKVLQKPNPLGTLILIGLVRMGSNSVLTNGFKFSPDKWVQIQRKRHKPNRKKKKKKKRSPTFFSRF